MAYNLGEIHNLIMDALGDEELTDLCLYQFRPVYERFTAGQTRAARVRMLIEYADRRREIPKLLQAVQESNPGAYDEFKERLGNAAGQQPGTERSEPAGQAPSGSSFSKPGHEPQKIQAEPTVETCDILVLAANPRNTDALQLESEAKLIRQRLQETAVGREYIVRAEHNVRVEELSRYLLQHQPIVVHFSGHGSQEGEIILENALGQAHPVSAEALAGLFAAVQGRVECVVLNACFSLRKADVLIAHVQCVVGMTQEIDDESALVFAGGFYRGIAFEKGYYPSFEIGRSEIALLNLPDEKVPRFVTRDPALLDAQAAKPRVTRTFPSPAQREQSAPLYPLWFGTNRQPLDPNDISQGFSSHRDQRIHYGTCRVAVPKSHKIGSTGSSWWRRLLTLTDDRLKLERDSLKTLAENSFWVSVKQALQEHHTDEPVALVFIHGFNVSFEAAALRAAQIGFDLQIPGITAFYSWPSQGQLTGYSADEASIQASERYIAEFLTHFAESSGAKQLHIIAHSMGNRGLLRSMQRILTQAELASRINFGQIFLAAADEDPDVFLDLAGNYQKIAQRTTLYVSAKDKALATSGIIHNYHRVGFYPPVTVIPGVDTVEVSNIDLTLLGHGYYADARPLLQDMYTLMQNDSPPHKRFGLQPATTSDNQPYWVIGK